MNLTYEEARAAATAYGWSVVPHDNGGFFAQRGQHRLIVTFDDHGDFRHAALRHSSDGCDESLMEGSVIGALAMYGAAPDRPESSKETTA